MKKTEQQCNYKNSRDKVYGHRDNAMWYERRRTDSLPVDTEQVNKAYEDKEINVDKPNSRTGLKA